jgi:hypothetical protein
MVQKRFLVPNLFTGLNFLIGIYAIMVMAESISPIQEAAESSKTDDERVFEVVARDSEREHRRSDVAVIYLRRPNLLGFLPGGFLRGAPA